MGYEVNDNVNWTALSAEAMKQEQQLNGEQGSVMKSLASPTGGMALKLGLVGVLFLVMAIVMLYFGLGFLLGVPGIGLAVCAYWMVFGR